MPLLFNFLSLIFYVKMLASMDLTPYIANATLYIDFI